MSYDEVKVDFKRTPDGDGLRHRLADGGQPRESAVLEFALPDEGVAALIYLWVNEDGRGGSSAYLFGDAFGGLIKERLEEIPVPSDMDFRDWDIGGLQMQIPRPHREVALTFKGPRVSLDCRYEALHPPYSFSAHKDGCPQYYSIDRTEQHGRLVGTLTVDGRSFDLDTTAFRDHSWGPRVWGLNQHYKWFHAATSKVNIHFFEMQSFGKQLVRGFVSKDGNMAQITGLDYDFTFDENMHQTTFAVTITDSMNRKTFVDSRIFAKTEYEVDPMILLKEGATAVEIEGESGSGWCEFCWNKEYFEFAKRYSAQYA